MKIVLISDTHGLHHQLEIPQSDILIHTGDISNKGSLAEIQDFLEWFALQPQAHKIFIAGNHDFYLEKLSASSLAELIPKNIHYLHNELLEIEGLKIWGSPVSPIPRKRWAFNRLRGEDIQKCWDLIPSNLDILLVHGPAFGILDQMINKELIGCKNLRQTILQKKPKVFVFGHIHESRGQTTIADIHCINASSVDRYRTQVFPPFVIELF